MWVILLSIVLGLVIAAVAGYKYMTGNKGYWPSKNVYFLDVNKVVPLKDQLTFKVTIQEIERKCYAAYKKAGVKNYAGIMEFRKPSFVVLDLEIMKHILVKDFDHFVNRRPSPLSEKAEPMFHKMLVNAVGQEWKDLRATVSPTFTTGKIRRMYEIFSESSKKLSGFIRHKAKTSTEMEIRDLTSRYTTDVIASAAFGLDSQVLKPDSNSEFSEMVKKFQGQFKGSKAWKLLILLLSPKLFQYLGFRIADQTAMTFFADVVKKTIKHREDTGEKRDDFLQLLIESRNLPENEVDTGNEKMDTYEKDAVLHKASRIILTEDLILSQSLLFFIAGFDTTESLLVLAAYELALNQDIQDKLYQELNAAAEKTGGKLSYDAVMECEYLDRVISETLRKYPPGVRTERLCVKDYKLPDSDVVIEKGTIVQIPIYGIHTDEDYYPDPDRFDPDRFTAENKAARHPYSYLPFGHGPRNCIAMRFALTEGKASIAHLILEFKLEPSPNTQIPLKGGLTSGFRPEGGLFLSVKSRK